MASQSVPRSTFLLLYFQTELRGMSKEAGGAWTSTVMTEEVAERPLLSVMMALSWYSPGEADHEMENELEVLVPTWTLLVKAWMEVMFVPPGTAVPLMVMTELAMVWPLVGLVIEME